MASEKKEQEKKEKGLSFFTKLKNSIFKIEKYPEMAIEGFGKAILYISKILIILAVAVSVWTLYKTNEFVQEGINYLQNDFPEFSYNDGTLNVESENNTIIENDKVGKIIIDTKTDSEEEINKYLNEINSEGTGILVLKNKVTLKNVAVNGEVSYNYTEVLKELNLTQFNKEDIVNYVKDGSINQIYLNIFLTIFLYSFVMYFINTLWYATVISIIGYLTIKILKLKVKFTPIYSMSVYALTLSTILNIIYVIINAIFNFNIKYFDIMYTTVATIYLIAAIFMLKSDYIKKSEEVMKIEEAQQIIKKEMEEERKEQEEKEEVKKKDKEKEKKEKKLNNDEPEQSNA